MKEKLIEAKANEKIIGIKINKREWQRLTASVIEFILISITILAIILLPVCLIGMINTWNISTPLIVFISCLAWLGSMCLYSYIVNKPTKKKNK